MKTQSNFTRVHRPLFIYLSVPIDCLDILTYYLGSQRLSRGGGEW